MKGKGLTHVYKVLKLTTREVWSVEGTVLGFARESNTSLDKGHTQKLVLDIYSPIRACNSGPVCTCMKIHT